MPAAPVFICFTRSVVETGNSAPFLSLYGQERLPSGPGLKKMMGSFSFFVDGYNDDPEEIYSIPAIREFFARLHGDWPYWLFFADLRSDSLRIISTCLLQNLTSQKITGSRVTRLEIDPVELALWVYRGFPPMNLLCERAGCSEKEIFDRTKALFQYFDLPFDQEFLEMEG